MSFDPIVDRLKGPSLYFQLSHFHVSISTSFQFSSYLNTALTKYVVCVAAGVTQVQQMAKF